MAEFDFNSLRKDLIDYFGTAAVSISFLAFCDLEMVEKASNNELLEIAKQCNFDLNKYRKNPNGNIRRR